MKNYTEQRLKEFDKKFKIMERIAHEEVDGIFALIEDRDKVKVFIAESIQQAVAKERGRESERKLAWIVKSLHEQALRISEVEKLTLEEMKEKYIKYIQN